MSDDLYYTRLRWSGASGIAKMHGMTVSLRAGPDLGSGPVWMIDYRPEVGFAQVQPRANDQPRSMTREEKHVADTMLRQLTEVIL